MSGAAVGGPQGAGTGPLWRPGRPKRALLVALLAGTSASCTSSPAALDPARLVLRGVTVIDGTGAPPAADRVLLIENGRIAAVADADFVAPAGVDELDLEGRWAMPGIVDTHVHMPGPADQPRFLSTLLAFGVTTARSTAAAPSGGIELRARLRNRELLGPRFLTAGRLIDGPETVWGGFGVVVTTEQEMIAEVRRQGAQKVDFIKLYAGIPPDLLRVAIGEAHDLGIPVIGHLGRTTWPEAVAAGIDAITHSCFWGMAHSIVPRADSAMFADFWAPRSQLDLGLMDDWNAVFAPSDPRFVTFATDAATRGVAMDPNLVLCEAVFRGDDPATRARLEPDLDVRPAPFPHPYASGWPPALFDVAEAMFGRVLEVVGELHRRGVLLTVGSDTLNPWMTPGVAAHRELELLVAAGLTPLEAITAATGNGARALGIFGETGTIEAGKSADLIILGADPAADIRNTRSIELVLSQGSLLDPGELLSGR